MMDAHETSRPSSTSYEPPLYERLRTTSDESRTFLSPTPNHDGGLPKTVNREAVEITPGEKGHTSIASRPLKRHLSPFFLASVYAVLAIFSWTVMCYLPFRPIGVRSYGVSTDYTGYGWMGPIAYHKLFVQSERYFSAARIINAFVAVLTIPLASALCANAAVIFMQQNRSNFTLRQAAALADQAWVQPEILLRLLHPKGWRRYGSRLLWLSILLHALGAALAPLQQAFVTQKTIKTPTWPELISNLADIPQFFTGEVDTRQDPLVTYLRYALTATNGNDIQPNLWLRDGPNCSSVSHGSVTADPLDMECVSTGGTSFATMNATQDPFICQLPAMFNTGLIRQFLPRLNSSLTYDAVDADQFPRNCDQLPGAFYANYTGQDQYHDFYSIQVCMPGNLTRSPWRATRDRQDITELLYLTVTAIGYGEMEHNATVFKVQANSTAGYFELPNYLIGAPGPLLEKDPNDLCDEQCLVQGEAIYHHVNKTKRATTPDGNSTLYSSEPNGTIALDLVPNRGPLLMVAEALFGETSYIATRTAHPDAYQLSQQEWDARPNELASDYICYDLLPLVSLSRNGAGIIADVQSQSCIDLAMPHDVDAQIANWLRLFWAENEELSALEDKNSPKYQMQPTLTAAVYLANQVWLKQGLQGIAGNLWVNYDRGADTVVPAISFGAMIAISTLLGLFILMLFAMAAYAAHVPSWTSKLDSFAMMRVGAAMGDALPFQVAFNADSMEVLDKTPGWIGDERPDEKVGRLGLGAQPRPRRGRRYECPEADRAPPDMRWRSTPNGPVYEPVPPVPSRDDLPPQNSLHTLWMLYRKLI